VALTGDLPGALLALKINYPLLAYPHQAADHATPWCITTWGVCGHFAWDLSKIGNQADKTSLLETPRVEDAFKSIVWSSCSIEPFAGHSVIKTAFVMALHACVFAVQLVR